MLFGWHVLRSLTRRFLSWHPRLPPTFTTASTPRPSDTSSSRKRSWTIPTGSPAPDPISPHEGSPKHHHEFPTRSHLPSARTGSLPIATATATRSSSSIQPPARIRTANKSFFPSPPSPAPECASVPTNNGGTTLRPMRKVWRRLTWTSTTGTASHPSTRSPRWHQTEADGSSSWSSGTQQLRDSGAACGDINGMRLNRHLETVARLVRDDVPHATELNVCLAPLAFDGPCQLINHSFTTLDDELDLFAARDRLSHLVARVPRQFLCQLPLDDRHDVCRDRALG